MVYFLYMVSKEVTLAELGAMLTHVVDHMATKEDIAEVKDDIANIGAAMATKNDLAQVFSDIKAIRDDLDDLGDAVGNPTGFRKEIDHALDRIAAIERHLGMKRSSARYGLGALAAEAKIPPSGALPAHRIERLRDWISVPLFGRRSRSGGFATSEEFLCHV